MCIYDQMRITSKIIINWQNKNYMIKIYKILIGP